MTEYHAPVEESLFVLFDLLKIDQSDYASLYQEMDMDTVRSIFSAYGDFCSKEIHPLNQLGDAVGCSFEDGSVKTPDGFSDVYQKSCADGWPSLICDPQYGGQGLPTLIGTLISEYPNSASISFYMYQSLTLGAYAAIHTCANDPIKSKFLPNMSVGKWSGTMNLTEPHCGTDLAQIKTKAVELDADQELFEISGTKIFISAGDHDLTENIIHLVLAKSEEDIDGVKGLSLFLVPKFKVDEDNKVIGDNGVSTGSIEKKMGLKANATCVMHFDKSQGYLVGKRGDGLKNMFIMMNEARLGVGVQGLALSEIAYQNAAAYAKERRQGHCASGRIDPDEIADPIIHHANIKSSLMRHKSFNMAARALIGEMGYYNDIIHAEKDKKKREKYQDRINLLTPIVKGYITDWAFDQCVTAQQVYGGHGYIAENGVEQFVRDCRITMIYEGTNDIQALDLMARKLPAKMGKTIMDYMQEMAQFILVNKGNERLKLILEKLELALMDMQKALQYLMSEAQKKPSIATSTAHDFMHLMGGVALGYIWAKMMLTSDDKLNQDETNQFYLSKIKLGNYYAAKILPKSKHYRQKILNGVDAIDDMDASWL